MNKSLEDLLKIRSKKKVDIVFDMVIFNAYLAGEFGQKLPVEDSRKVFEHIKKLLCK